MKSHSASFLPLCFLAFTVTFDGNVVANSGANGFQINNSSGAGTFTGNVVDGVGAYQSGSAPFFNGGGGGYTVTASDNSWQ